MAKKEEDRFVREIARQLHESFGYRVECLRRPGSSPPLKKHIRSKTGFDPILQPELDLLFWKGNDLCAVEVKLFRRSKASFSTPYYVGIGQALSLLSFGFDHVALWYLFYTADLPEVKKAYGPATWHLVRNKLKLPLEFTPLEIVEANGKIDFVVWQYKNEFEWTRKSALNTQDKPPALRNRNPLRDKEPAKTIRSALDLWFDGQLPRISTNGG